MTIYCSNDDNEAVAVIVDGEARLTPLCQACHDSFVWGYTMALLGTSYTTIEENEIVPKLANMIYDHFYSGSDLPPDIAMQTFEAIKGAIRHGELVDFGNTTQLFDAYEEWVTVKE